MSVEIKILPRKVGEAAAKSCFEKFGMKGSIVENYPIGHFLINLKLP